jgi:hypothetical protein
MRPAAHPLVHILPFLECTYHCLTANPVKAGDAKLRGYRAPRAPRQSGRQWVMVPG